MLEPASKASTRLRVLPTEEYFSIVKHQLAQSGQAHVRVTGNSMYPLLHHLRDSVTLVPPEKLRTGDIVLFDRRNSRYALHRIIRRGKTGFTMAGDNQYHIEKNLPYGQIIGVVSAIRRNGREIPAGKFFYKFFAAAAILAVYPRMYICKALKALRRLTKGTGK